MFPQNVQIDGRGVEVLPEWRDKIMAELAKVQKHAYDVIHHARVEIIATGHHRHGAFEMRAVVTVPGHTITISRQGAYVLPMIVEAFKALDRRLKEHSQVRQGKVKVHGEVAKEGVIARLFAEEDYGFLETPEGLEVYFHANALQKRSFDQLTPGLKVEFAQDIGEKGPQATWVRVVE